MYTQAHRVKKSARHLQQRLPPRLHKYCLLRIRINTVLRKRKRTAQQCKKHNNILYVACTRKVGRRRRSSSSLWSRVICALRIARIRKLSRAAPSTYKYLYIQYYTYIHMVFMAGSCSIHFHRVVCVGKNETERERKRGQWFWLWTWSAFRMQSAGWLAESMSKRLNKSKAWESSTRRQWATGTAGS